MTRKLIIKKTFYLLLVGVIFLPAITHAQYVLTTEQRHGKFGIHTGLNVPIGDFSNSDGSFAGGAQTGYTIGLEYLLPITPDNQHFSWMSTVSLMVNGTDLPNGFPTIQLSGNETSWYHIAPMVGLRYSSMLKKPISGYLFLQTGAIYGNSPQIESIDYLDATRFTHAYQRSGTAWSYAFQGGLGINIGMRLEVEFNGLVSGIFHYKIETLGRYFFENSNIPLNYVFPLRQTVDMLQLRLGYYFGA